MDNLIKRIADISESLETFVWILNDKEDHGTLKGDSMDEQIDLYSNTQFLLRDIFQELRENHGSKIVR